MMLATYLQYVYLEKVLQPTDFCKVGVKLTIPSTANFLPATHHAPGRLPGSKFDQKWLPPHNLQHSAND